MLVPHPLLEPQEDLVHWLVTVFEIDALLPAVSGLERGLLPRGADRREGGVPASEGWHIGTLNACIEAFCIELVSLNF